MTAGWALLAMLAPPLHVTSPAEEPVEPGPGGCPATIAPTEASPGPDGWRGRLTRRPIDRFLMSVTFADGDPAGDGFALIPDKVEDVADGRIQHYDFRDEGLGTVWMQCLYAGSVVGLARATTLKGERCEARYRYFPADLSFSQRLVSLTCTGLPRRVTGLYR